MLLLKDFFIHVWAILVHPRWWLRGKSILILSSIKGKKSNELQLNNCSLKRTQIIFQGARNSIHISNNVLYNCHISFRGVDHRLIIEEGVQLFNVQIRVIGNGNTIYIGHHSSFGSGHIVCGGNGIAIHIGSECMFADGIDIWSTDTHSVLQNGRTINAPQSITIGNHVWCGKEVAILKGVTIGDNAVIGMRSLVTKDIRPATLNVGSPVREIRSCIDWSRNNPNNE